MASHCAYHSFPPSPLRNFNNNKTSSLVLASSKRPNSVLLSAISPNKDSYSTFVSEVSFSLSLTDALMSVIALPNLIYMKALSMKRMLKKKVHSPNLMCLSAQYVHSLEKFKFVPCSSLLKKYDVNFFFGQ